MFVRFSKLFLTAALATMLVAHWAALQTVAWTTMLADNLHSAPLEEALVKTFDGKHPCSLCKAIAAGKKSERKAEFTTSLQKLEYPPLAAGLNLLAPSRFEWLPVTDFFGKSLSQKPSLRPPRSFFV